MSRELPIVKKRANNPLEEWTKNMVRIYKACKEVIINFIKEMKKLEQQK